MKTPPPLPPLPANPLVSVVVPSYNQGAFIRQTLESCLAQDYRPIEVVVVDGASTDGTVAVLESFSGRPEVRWVSEPDAGVVDAVNKGLARARGEIAVIQSSDDFFLPGCFSAVAEGFRKRPAAGLVFGDVERVDAEGQAAFSPRQPRYSLARLLARELFIYQPTAFFRRELALELGGWNPEIPYVPDIDLWIRLAFRAEVAQLDAVLAAYRSHPGQRDKHRQNIYRDYLRMLELSREIPAAPRPLRRAVERLPCVGGGKEIPATVSIGVCGGPLQPADGWDRLVQGADEALYAAKLAGRNRVESTALAAPRPAPVPAVD